MSGYTPNVIIVTDFEGDQIKITMTRMKRKHLSKLIPYMTHNDETGDVSVKFQDQVEMASVATEWLPGYVTDFVGLKDGDGNALGFDVVLEQAYFYDLLTEILSALFESSNLSKKDEKKLDKLSPEVPQGSALEAVS